MDRAFSGRVSGCSTETRRKLRVSGRRPADHPPGNHGGCPASHGSRLQRASQRLLHGNPKKTAGQRAATSRPPPGQPRRLPRKPWIAPSAGESAVAPRKPEENCGSAGGDQPTTPRATTAAAPQAMDRAFSGRVSGCSTETRRKLRVSGRRPADHPPGNHGGCPASHGSRLQRASQRLLHGNPKKTAGQRAATSRPPPGQPRRLPRKPWIAPSAGESAVAPRKPEENCGSAGGDQPTTPRATTAAAPQAMDRAFSGRVSGWRSANQSSTRSGDLPPESSSPNPQPGHVRSAGFILAREEEVVPGRIGLVGVDPDRLRNRDSPQKDAVVAEDIDCCARVDL